MTQNSDVGLSIVIVSWNTRELLRECLLSIYKNYIQEPFEIIVVDNDSADGSADMIAQEFPSILLKKNTGNIGFGHACNQALKMAAGKHILLLNPDTRIVDNAIYDALCFIRSTPDVGIVGAKLLYADGSFQPSCGNFPSFRTILINTVSRGLVKTGLHRLTKAFLAMCNLKLMPVNELKCLFEKNRIQEVDWVIGAFQLIDRKALDEDRIFDEDFVMYVEDQDLCRRVKNRRLKVVYYPVATVYHIEGASAAQYPTERIIAKVVAMALFYRKHHGQFASVLYRASLFICEVLKFGISVVHLMIHRNKADFKRRIFVHWSLLKALWKPTFVGLLHERSQKS